METYYRSFKSFNKSLYYFFKIFKKISKKLTLKLNYSTENLNSKSCMDKSAINVRHSQEEDLSDKQCLG